MGVFIATQNVRLLVNGRSIDLQMGEPCSISEDEAASVAPGLLIPSTQAEIVSTIMPNADDESPRFERKKGKR